MSRLGASLVLMSAFAFPAFAQAEPTRSLCRDWFARESATMIATAHNLTPQARRINELNTRESILEAMVLALRTRNTPNQHVYPRGQPAEQIRNSFGGSLRSPLDYSVNEVAQLVYESIEGLTVTATRHGERASRRFGLDFAEAGAEFWFSFDSANWRRLHALGTAVLILNEQLPWGVFPARPRHTPFGSEASTLRDAWDPARDQFSRLGIGFAYFVELAETAAYLGLNTENKKALLEWVKTQMAERGFSQLDDETVINLRSLPNDPTNLLLIRARKWPARARALSR